MKHIGFDAGGGNIWRETPRMWRILSWLLGPSPPRLTIKNSNSHNSHNMDNMDNTTLVRLIEDILRQTNIPPGPLQQIFDYAGVGVRHDEVTRRYYAGRENDNSSYFQVVVRPVPEFVLHQMGVVTRSRDQGWSDYPADHGTRNGSWTWVELRIGDNGAERIRLVTNIHAGQEWERTENVFGPNDAVPQRLETALQTNALTTITLYTRSCFPGWTCRMNGAEVRLVFAPNVNAIADRLHMEAAAAAG